MKKVREGYKITELGEIPEEWDIEYIDNVAKRYSGHTPDKKIQKYWNGNIPWVSLKDTKRLDSRYIGETEDYTTQEGINNSSAVLLPEGTVVLSRDATVGKVGITDKQMATSQHFINYVCSEKLNNLYLYYDFLNRKSLFERIGAGSTIKTIGLGFFKYLKIILPPILEQKEISNILYIVDEQIENTDNLIEKTKELKKGLMQKLLTKGIGHDRFKDSEIGRIPEEWKIELLGNIGEFKNGLNKGKEDFGFGYKFVNIQDAYIGNVVNTDKLERINANQKEVNIYSLDKGDIVLVRSSVKPEGVGYPILYNDDVEKVLYCGFMIRYRYDINKYNPKYMLYQLRSNGVRKRILDLSTVSANTNINQDSLKQIKVAVPSLIEQKQISLILSSVDEQIEQYESKKEKLQELKKGLMKKLLTGKIRVKV